MGIFSRIKNIASSEISDIKNRHNSENDISEYITDRIIELADIKRSLAELVDHRVRLERQLAEYDQQISRFQGLAEKALKAGSEEDARTFLAKKHQLEKEKAGITQRYEEICRSIEQLKKTYDQMAAEINELKERMNSLKGREAAADARQTYNEMKDSSTADELFNKWESDVDIKEGRADAGDYSSAESDPLSDEIEKLRQKLDETDRK